MKEKEKTIEFYNNYSQRQLAVGVNKRHYSIIKFLNEFGLQKNNSVLEIGCGIGTLTSLLLKI